MDRINFNSDKDYMELLEELVNKINEIVDWINSQ